MLSFICLSWNQIMMMPINGYMLPFVLKALQALLHPHLLRSLPSQQLQRVSNFVLAVVLSAQDPICADFRPKGINFLQSENWNICCNNWMLLEPIQQLQRCGGWWPVHTPQNFRGVSTSQPKDASFQTHSQKASMSKKAEISDPYVLMLHLLAEPDSCSSAEWEFCKSRDKKDSETAAFRKLLQGWVYLLFTWPRSWLCNTFDHLYLN